MEQMPEVVIIYLPGDGQAHFVGANRKGGEWRFSRWQYLPTAEVNAFIAEGMESGMSVFDVRLQASQHTPGMETATPILMYRNDVTLKQAQTAFELLHRAIERGVWREV